MSEEEVPSKCRFEYVKQKLIKYRMIILTIIAVIIGILFPKPGQYVAKTPFAKICLIIIFFICGLKLNTDRLKKSIHSWPAAVSSIIFILFLTPIIGFLLLFIPLTPQEFILGLACVTCSPSTMAVGSVLTEQCGGNFCCGLFLSVATNMLGIIVVPFTVDMMFRSIDVDIHLDAVGMCVGLLYQIAIPMIVGCLLSTYIHKVSTFVKKYDSVLKYLSSFLLCLSPWLKVSTSAEIIYSVPISGFFETLGLVFVVNMIFFFASLFMAWVFRFSLEDTKAVTLCCTGKTLPIALTIVTAFNTSMGNPKLIIIPCLLFQFVQLITTTTISGFYGGITIQNKTFITCRSGEYVSQSETCDNELKIVKSIENSLPIDNIDNKFMNTSENNPLNKKNDQSNLNDKNDSTKADTNCLSSTLMKNQSSTSNITPNNYISPVQV